MADGVPGELLTFPAAKHDDQVDALGQMAGCSRDDAAPVPKEKPRKPIKDGYTRAVQESDGYRTI